MKKLLESTLGIVTSIGGFLEVDSIATAAQAGALFGLQLTWAVALGGLCVIFLVEIDVWTLCGCQQTHDCRRRPGAVWF
jgi:hypothetical protein